MGYANIYGTNLLSSGIAFKTVHFFNKPQRISADSSTAVLTSPLILAPCTAAERILYSFFVEANIVERLSASSG